MKSLYELQQSFINCGMSQLHLWRLKSVDWGHTETKQIILQTPGTSLQTFKIHIGPDQTATLDWPLEHSQTTCCVLVQRGTSGK